MQSRLNPYLSFKDNAREAIEFYKSLFGGTLNISAFKDIPNLPIEPEEQDLTMHAMLEADNGIVLMAADTPKHMGGHARPNGALSLSGDNEEELKGYWDKLAEGGKVNQPLMKAPWGDSFGMLTDKFGIDWMVNISGKKG